MSQKRHSKNLKRKKSKPSLSKFERRQERVRSEIINDGLQTIRKGLLSNLDKNTQAYHQSYDSHHSTASRPTAV